MQLAQKRSRRIFPLSFSRTGRGFAILDKWRARESADSLHGYRILGTVTVDPAGPATPRIRLEVRESGHKFGLDTDSRRPVASIQRPQKGRAGNSHADQFPARPAIADRRR